MRSAKADKNQKEIVAALRKMGCTVESLHRVGGGVPDLLVGFHGRNYLVECKMPGKPLNELQKDWISSWRGMVYQVSTLDQVRILVDSLP
jgi:Holliday junction resolvase